MATLSRLTYQLQKQTQRKRKRGGMCRAEPTATSATDQTRGKSAVPSTPLKNDHSEASEVGQLPYGEVCSDGHARAPESGKRQFSASVAGLDRYVLSPLHQSSARQLVSTRHRHSISHQLVSSAAARHRHSINHQLVSWSAACHRHSISHQLVSSPPSAVRTVHGSRSAAVGRGPRVDS